MEAHVVSSAISRRDQHRYDLQSFNVTADEIADAFEDYRAQHGFN
jgi:hypothetical protein